MNALQKRSYPVIDQLPHMMRLVSRSSVHPVHYQQELKQVQLALLAYRRKN